MRMLLVGLVGISLAVAIGCSGQGTSGGPGKTNTTQKEPIIGQGEETFSLHTPMLSTHLKQGEQKQIDISIKRGKNFQEDVALKFEGLPKGVTADPAAPAIKHSDGEAKVTLKAADDAATGDFEVKVIGHPTKGTEAGNTFKLTIDKK